MQSVSLPSKSVWFGFSAHKHCQFKVPWFSGPLRGANLNQVSQHTERNLVRDSSMYPPDLVKTQLWFRMEKAKQSLTWIWTCVPFIWAQDNAQKTICHEQTRVVVALGKCHSTSCAGCRGGTFLSLALFSKEVIQTTCTQCKSHSQWVKAQQNKNRSAAGRWGSRPNEVPFHWGYAATTSKSAWKSDLLQGTFAEAIFSQNASHHPRVREISVAAE